MALSWSNLSLKRYHLPSKWVVLSDVVVLAVVVTLVVVLIVVVVVLTVVLELLESSENDIKIVKN